MEPTDDTTRIKELERKVRTLERKLTRSETDRQELEKANEVREVVLKNVIRELEESKIVLEDRGDDLEATLINLKALQVKLVESEKMSALGVLVAGIAHEINNPVSFIYGNMPYAKAHIQDLLKLIRLYQQQYPEPTAILRHELEAIDLEFIGYDAARMFQSMTVGAERIREIVKSLRTFSRLDESGFKVADIHAGLESTLVILNSRLKAFYPNGIQLIREYSPLPSIACYPGALNQVFLNIIVNAIDSLEERVAFDPYPDPTICIRTELEQEKWVKIAMADNALGMNETVKSKLFDPFFTTKQVGKGTGLGLAIARQIIVEQHHGSLEVSSVVGQGSEFTIKLPVH
ncbi:MAG: sensor histidine kinase [Timaviella obliquedivisa GSE-PSE-MK23-08B]|jgi:signal transduction histidine kinase|nr:sensor histidine kinase [Timaviella obliquedivisa GSE-PSE-MK23-08B]